MTDHEKRIREALEAGPTEREWLIDHRDPRFVYALNVEGYNQFWAHVQGPHTRTFELEANARLIAACNPAAIRAMLADLDAVRGALSAAKDGGWLPIETAPNGASVLILRRGDLYPGVAFLSLDRWHWSSSGAWAGHPTHWQPLPAPPAQRGEG